MRWPTIQSKINEWAEKGWQWHRWYAWHPIVIKGFDLPDEWVWGENVERVREYGNWKYRPVSSKEEEK